MFSETKCLCFKVVAGFVFLIFASNSFGADKASDVVLSRALTRVNLFSAWEIARDIWNEQVKP